MCFEALQWRILVQDRQHLAETFFKMFWNSALWVNSLSLLLWRCLCPKPYCFYLLAPAWKCFSKQLSKCWAFSPAPLTSFWRALFQLEQACHCCDFDFMNWAFVYHYAFTCKTRKQGLSAGLGCAIRAAIWTLSAPEMQRAVCLGGLCHICSGSCSALWSALKYEVIFLLISVDSTYRR